MAPAHDLDKLLRAIDLIIKDVDKKYDECLVDQFLDSIRGCGFTDILKPQKVEPILDRLKSYLDHKAFVMLNQARAYKTFESVLRSDDTISDSDFTKVKPYFESLWDSMDVNVINSNLAAITIMFSILRRLINKSGSGFYWLIDKKIEPPIKFTSPHQFEIKDITTLIKFYMCYCNNYHTRNKAERLLGALIEKSCTKTLPHTHSQAIGLKETVNDLMLAGSTSIICVVFELFGKLNKTSSGMDSFLERYNLRDLTVASFDALIDQKGPRLNNVCKCLATIGSSKNMKSNLAKLISRNKLEAIIIYLTHMEHKDSEIDQLLMTYTLYPILTTCSGEDTELYIQKLLATRDERDFIDKNLNDKLVTLAFVQLKQVLSKKTEQSRFVNNFSQRTILLIMNTMTDYIRCHHLDLNKLKNISESCGILRLIERMYRVNEEATIFQSLEGLHSTIRAIKFDGSFATRSITRELLKLIRSTHRNYSHLRQTGFHDKICLFVMKTIDLAFEYEDQDILDEFVLFFGLNKFDFRDDSLDDRRYVELIWKHIYPKAKDADHRDLLGNLAKLLIDIDIFADRTILDHFKITRYHEIPTILSNILLDYDFAPEIVEKVICALNPPVCRFVNETAPSLEEPLGYISCLDSRTLPVSVRKGLDRLVYGLCTTIKGESEELCRRDALSLVIDFITQMITNYDSSETILVRLAKAGVLETLFDVGYCHSYSLGMHERTNCIVNLLKSNVISQVNNSEDKLRKYLINQHDKKYCYEHRSDKVKAIIDFYTRPPRTEVPDDGPSFESESRVKTSTLVDDILDFDLKADGILDCY